MGSPNSIRARLTARAEGWRWSSARANLLGQDDGLCAVAPLRDAIGDWSVFLAGSPREEELEALRRHERTARPLGDSQFALELDWKLGRRLRLGKPGRWAKLGPEAFNA